MFGKSKKRLAQKMIYGINGIKLILYKILIDDLSNKFKDVEFCGYLSGAIVNEIFDDHTDKSKGVLDNNKDLVLKEIKNLGQNHPDLKQTITDSLRVWMTANYALGSKKMADVEYITNLVNKSYDRGIFIKGGDAPTPQVFFDRIQMLANKYKVREAFNFIPFEHRWNYVSNSIPKRENDATCYCPKCGAQYRKGFTVCSDCGIELINF